LQQLLDLNSKLLESNVKLEAEVESLKDFVKTSVLPMIQGDSDEQPSSQKPRRDLKKKGKKGKGKGKGKKTMKRDKYAKQSGVQQRQQASPTYDLQVSDPSCTEFCEEFFTLCRDWNFFDIGMEGCLETCQTFPRTKSQEWLDPSHLHSDTFECRRFHVFENFVDTPQFHCWHALAETDHICGDIEIDGVTPYQAMRDGLGSLFHYGYCDLIASETVADCSLNSITDEQLPYVLQTIPATVKTLFLNGNPGITEIPSGLFDNLEDPLHLKALYLDDCNITTLHADSFLPLQNLELLNLPLNFISVLPDGLLRLPNLRSFSIYGVPDPLLNVKNKPGLLDSSVSYNDTLFQDTPNIERILMHSHRGITEVQPGLLQGLTMLDTLYFVFCGLTNAGMPPEAFQDLASMRFFDFQGCPLTEFNPDWFSGLMNTNVERLAFFLMDLAPITDVSVFENMPNLRQAFFHQNPRLLSVPGNMFQNNPQLEVFTLGEGK